MRWWLASGQPWSLEWPPCKRPPRVLATTGPKLMAAFVISRQRNCLFGIHAVFQKKRTATNAAIYMETYLPTWIEWWSSHCNQVHIPWCCLFRSFFISGGLCAGSWKCLLWRKPVCSCQVPRYISSSNNISYISIKRYLIYLNQTHLISSHIEYMSFCISQYKYK